jgi:CO/xanthine dehydrogenase Mo-binding subunit
LGESIQRIDAVGKVKGEAFYPGDIDMPGQAHMKILFALRPHAIVRHIDTSAAEAMEGVIAVYTAKDVPVNEYGSDYGRSAGIMRARISKTLYADRVRFIGDQVAVVVAETEDIAARARDLQFR